MRIECGIQEKEAEAETKLKPDVRLTNIPEIKLFVSEPARWRRRSTTYIHNIINILNNNCLKEEAAAQLTCQGKWLHCLLLDLLFKGVFEKEEERDLCWTRALVIFS